MIYLALGQMWVSIGHQYSVGERPSMGVLPYPGAGPHARPNLAQFGPHPFRRQFWNDGMRLLIGLLLLNRQIDWLFREEGKRFRFFPAGKSLPSLLVDSRQRGRIKERLPAVYVRLIAMALGANLVTIGGIVLWDRFVGYVDALAALGVFGANLIGLGALLHGWLYLAVRQIVRDSS